MSRTDGTRARGRVPVPSCPRCRTEVPAPGLMESDALLDRTLNEEQTEAGGSCWRGRFPQASANLSSAQRHLVPGAVTARGVDSVHCVLPTFTGRFLV